MASRYDGFEKNPEPTAGIGPVEYADILIHIREFSKERGTYPVEAELDERRHYRDGELRVDMTGLLGKILDPEKYGFDLSDALFAGPIRRAYEIATGRAEAKTGGNLRVRLWIDDKATRLHAIPWERIYHTHRGQNVPLATSALTPFSRYTASEKAEPKPVSEWPIRLLFAIADPSDLKPKWHLPPIPVEEEVQALFEALGDLRQGPFQVTLLPGRNGLSDELRAELQAHGYTVKDGKTTLTRILHHLNHPRGHHVFHFLGHGTFRRVDEQDEGTAALLLEGEDGTTDVVKDDDLKDKLANVDPQPHLVFLAACQSAKRPEKSENAYVGLAPKLVEAGVPAVVAMQDLLKMDVARELTFYFYRRLAGHGVVDRALNEARNLLFEGEKIDWAIPVLFLRLKDGRLMEAHPARLALEATRDHETFAFFADDNARYLPLPVEAIHLTEQQDFRGFAQMAADPTAAVAVEEAVKGLFQRLEQPAQGLPRRRLVVLTGGYGCNKTSQLRRITWLTARDSLKPEAEERILPVYVDLAQFPRVRREWHDPVEELVRESLQDYCQLTPSQVDQLLKDRSTTLRLLFDNMESLTERQRRTVCGRIRRFMSDHRQHQYILASDPAAFDAGLFRGIHLDILVIQRLERRKIRHFLQGLVQTVQIGPRKEEQIGERLLETLDRSGLFDLAAVASFLVRLVRYAETGQYPTSRAQFMQQVMGEMTEHALVRVEGGQGVGTDAEEVLQAIAWQMQSGRSATLTLTEVFAIMDRVRGNREYDLETFYEGLVEAKLLAREGIEDVRFAHDRIRAYCCAKEIIQRPDRDQVLEEITASLGRLTRLRWWGETLVFVCGLLTQDREALKELLEVIVYGVNLLEGEQAFLAARCLMESQQQKLPGLYGFLEKLREQVASALAWRLSNRNEPRAAQRSRAALLLGQIADEKAVERLANTAYKKTRIDRSGKPDYDYSNVRMAAVIGLLRMEEREREKLLRGIAPILVDMLYSWQEGRVDDMVGWLEQAEDTSARGIAALALADLRMRLILGKGSQVEADKALEALANAFFDPELEDATMWAVTYALAIIDLPMVKEAVIDPFLKGEAEPKPSAGERDRIRRRKCMAYLIGLLRWQGSDAYEFLEERCLEGTDDIRLAAVAIFALGRLANERYRGRLIQIAAGEFEQVLPDLPTDNPKDLAYLQRTAVTALSGVGDLSTVVTLRESCKSRAPDDSGLDRRLEEALYRTSEEIFWRLNWDRYL
jgi:hypothetical protein